MATLEALLKLIRAGKSAREIRKALSLTPGAFRRMVRSRRFQAELATDRELAEVVAAHQRARQAERVTQRLAELADSDNDETARKACVELLGSQAPSAGSGATAKPPAAMHPWPTNDAEG